MRGFALSPQQRHLWQLQQEDGPSPYRARCAVRLTGPLRTDPFRRAVQDAVDRHEVLRTSFQKLPELKHPLQFIAAESAIAIAERDLSALPPRDRQEQLAALLVGSAPLSPEPGGVLSSLLIRLGPEEHLALFEAPALCADLKGLEQLVLAVAHGYAGATDAAAEGLIQYADAAAWLNELLTSEETASGRKLWLRQDFSPLVTVRLPFERPSREPGFRPRRLALRIDPVLAREITAFARDTGASLRVLVLACWQALLARWSGKSDLVLGIACDGRNHPELTTALGLFARHLPLRVRMDGSARFPEVLGQLEESMERLGKWQQYFSWEALAKEDRSGAAEGCNTGWAPFCFEHAEPARSQVAAGVDFSLVRRHACFDRFALKLFSEDREDALALELQYDARRFSAADLLRLGESLETLLAQAVRRPHAAVGDLEIRSPADRHRVLVELNASPAGRPPATAVHREVERQAAARPGAPAVAGAGGTLTYDELNRRANRLARHLRALGVGPEALVALCLPREVETVVAILAVLKAGGGYLPLDPVLPKQRLAFMLRDSGAQLLVTRREPAAAGDGYAGKVLLLEESADEIAGLDDADLDGGAVPGALVYAMYTSGSTGRPKAVAVEHRQLLHYVRGISARLSPLADLGLATVSTFAADLGNTAIFPALCDGGCLHVVAQEQATDPNALADYAAQHAVDLLKIVPSHLEALLASPRAQELLPRRFLILGGEAWGWELLARVRSLAPGCRVLNHYGPTETTVGVLAGEALAGEVEDERRSAGSSTVPLGRPLPGSRAYLLDARLNGVPTWVTAELYLGGPGVTRGYLGCPELTAERFVPDPFGEEPGARLYRTGDLVRCLPDGTLAFVGRVDHQAKVRGHRIELGEIEAVLAQHPAVRTAVALVREDAPGDKRLVAYVVPSPAALPAVSDLRAFLGERLPEYMVPAAFLVLRSLPLTPNGKVDRGALSAPEAVRPELEVAYVAPQTDLEETIAAIWRRALRVERVGLRDNFFDLGGHSLLLVEVSMELQRSLGREIPITELFRYPTIGALTESLDRSGSAPTAPEPSADVRGRSRRDLIDSQRRRREQRLAN